MVLVGHCKTFAVCINNSDLLKPACVSSAYDLHFIEHHNSLCWQALSLIQLDMPPQHAGEVLLFKSPY